jgi:hypothetical protein
MSMSTASDVGNQTPGFINWKDVARIERAHAVCREGPADSIAERRLVLARVDFPADNGT